MVMATNLRLVKRDVRSTPSDTNSCSILLRDTFYDALARDAFFAGYTKRKSKMIQGQPTLLPFLGVYILDEVMLPDGDPNAGNYKFSHTLRIGFSVVHANNDPVQGEMNVDAAFWRIMYLLWADP